MDDVSMAKICARIKWCRCSLSAIGEFHAKNKNAQPKAERSNASATCMFARTANGTSAAAHKKSGVLARDREDFARHVGREVAGEDRKSTRLNSSHVRSSYAVFCLKKK